MAKPKFRRKRVPKRVLALPDLEHAKTAVLNSQPGPIRCGRFDLSNARHVRGHAQGCVNERSATGLGGHSFLA